MRTVGIVCEYNPYHNGHLNHMRRASAQPDGEYIICIQSSDFLQRGEPAILPKNLRAESAVKNGADLIFELPSVFSCSSAEYFASAAVQMMHRLGVVDSIVFGSENNDISLMKKISGILLEEPPEFKTLLKNNLATGISYAKARALSLVKYFDNPQIKELAAGSNNILGIEYIKAIKKFNVPINPISVPRIAEAYKSEDISGLYPSATAIRQAIMTTGIGSVVDFLPPASFDILREFYTGKENYVNIELLKDAVFYRIASLGTSELREFPGVTEGFENRLKSALSKAGSLMEFIDICSTKRYPKTRISRTLIYILLNLKNDEAKSIWAAGPLYARLLSASSRGLDLIPVLEKNARIPVFTSLKPFYDNARPSWKKILDYEIKAADIYSVAAGLPTGRDYKIKFNVF